MGNHPGSAGWAAEPGMIDDEVTSFEIPRLSRSVTPPAVAHRRHSTCDAAPPDHQIRDTVHAPLLTREQRGVVARIEDFLQSDEQVFVLFGLAGVGKTVLLAAVARMLPDAPLVAPTGKAAEVLRQKTGRNAQTIHGLVYSLREKSTDHRGREVLWFDPRLSRGALKGEVVLLDECSMVTCEWAKDLLDTGPRSSRRVIPVSCHR